MSARFVVLALPIPASYFVIHSLPDGACTTERPRRQAQGDKTRNRIRRQSGHSSQVALKFQSPIAVGIRDLQLPRASDNVCVVLVAGDVRFIIGETCKAELAAIHRAAAAIVEGSSAASPPRRKCGNERQGGAGRRSLACSRVRSREVLEDVLHDARARSSGTRAWWGLLNARPVVGALGRGGSSGPSMPRPGHLNFATCDRNWLYCSYPMSYTWRETILQHNVQQESVT
ncbi:hypothetical protein B0H19DRAFT_1062792 [Mycena capillaripes]|nr:hypothetical protein B0H19DRAFT_1062792 [Mycena capillaripes]